MKRRHQSWRLPLPLLLGVCASCQAPAQPARSDEPASEQRAAARLALAAPQPSREPEAPPEKADERSPQDDDAAKEATTSVRVRAEGQLGPGTNTLFIDIAPPEGAKLTAESPLNVRGSGGIGLDFPRRLNGPLSSHPMPLRLPIDVADGATGPARVELTYYWCTEGNEAACRRERAQLDVELDLSGSGAGGEAHLSYRARGES